MLASSDSAVPESTPRPSFFAYALYERAFGHRMIDASSSEPRLKVYASRFAGGQVGLVVVNEQSEPVTVNVDLGGLGLNGTAVAWVLDADDLNAKQVRWNGVAGPDRWFATVRSPFRGERGSEAQSAGELRDRDRSLLTLCAALVAASPHLHGLLAEMTVTWPGRRD